MKYMVASLFLAITFQMTTIGFAQSTKESSDPYFNPLVPAKTSPSTTINRSGQAATDPGTSQFRPQSNFGKSTNNGQFAGQQTSYVPTPKESATVKRPISQPALVNPGQNESPPNQSSFEPTRILARVADQPIFVSDLSVEAMQLVDKFMAAAPPAVKKREARKLIPRLLPKYIQAKLLLVDAIQGLPEGDSLDDIFKSAGDQFDEAMLPKLMENVKVQSPAKLDAYYRALGSSLRNVKRSWIESELVKFTMRSKINVNPEVSHRELYDYYLANKSKYSNPARVNWEQLVVRYSEFPTQADARIALAKMGDEVVYGAPLDAVAKRESQGYKASDGGQQGWTTKGSLVDKKLDELLFSIEPNKLSEITPIRGGLAIIRVKKREQAGFTPFESTQSEIKDLIRSQKQEVEFQNHVDKVKSRIPVEVFEPTMMAHENNDSDTTRR